MTRARDSQRSKYWKAIEVMNGIERTLTTGETGRLARSVGERKFLTSRYPELKRSYRVVLKGGTLKGSYWELNIPMTQHTDWAVVQVAARMIFYRRDPFKQLAWYGWEFCSIVVDCTQALMGKEAAVMLRESMRLHRVRFKPKKTRTVTPEMLEHLAQARAKMESVS